MYIIASRYGGLCKSWDIVIDFPYIYYGGGSRMLENLWENLTYIVFTSKLKFRILDLHTYN